MLSYTTVGNLFIDFFVFWLRFFSQFWLILHLLYLDLKTHSECGSGSRKPIECGSGSKTLIYPFCTYDKEVPMVALKR
jgi:hypothetical protein